MILYHFETDTNNLAGKNGMVRWSVQNIRSVGDTNCNYCISNVSNLLIRKGYWSHINDMISFSSTLYGLMYWSANVLDLLLLVTWTNLMPWNMPNSNQIHLEQNNKNVRIWHGSIIAWYRLRHTAKFDVHIR